MDTIFMDKRGYNGLECAQVFVELMSQMINVYPMPSKASTHIVKVYQDFMRYEGLPAGLHQDLASAEKVNKIIDINRDMIVKDTWSETGHPNENPAEALDFKPLKTGISAIIDRQNIEDCLWPDVAKYIAEINNICATPVLGWQNPFTSRHGYTKDISPYLEYSLGESVYFKMD